MAILAIIAVRKHGSKHATRPPSAGIHCCLHKFGSREMLQNWDAWPNGCPKGKIPARGGSLRLGRRARRRAGICAPRRRAWTRVPANRANITHLTAKRDNFDGWPTCAGGERRATGQQMLDSCEPRPACPETSSQRQSACFFPLYANKGHPHSDHPFLH